MSQDHLAQPVSACYCYYYHHLTAAVLCSTVMWCKTGRQFEEFYKAKDNGQKYG